MNYSQAHQLRSFCSKRERGGSKSKNAGREFHLISIAKIRNFGGGLSVSVRSCPYKSVYVCFCLFAVTGRCYTARTATGGRSLSRGLTPSTTSSSLWRDSHLWNVLIITPAASASCAFDIDFIILKFLELISFLGGVITPSHNAGICVGLCRYMR